MSVLKIVLVLIAAFGAIAVLAFMAALYARRTDRSFWGGADLLTGWWLVLPPKTLDLPPDANRLLWEARVAWLVTILAGLGAWACSQWPSAA